MSPASRVSLFSLLLPLPCLHAETRYVAPSGFVDTNANPATNPATPWSLTRACSRAVAGDLILVAPGTYSGVFSISASGTPAAPIVFRANGATDTVILDGTGVSNANSGLFHIRAGNGQIRSNIVIDGFTMRNLTTSDGSGVRLVSSGTGIVSSISIRNCHIHDMFGTNAMGVTVYGTGGTNAITDVTVESCHIHNCAAAPSEAITFNGNISGFAIKNCLVHDCNNIGIDMIGGEAGFPAGIVPGDTRVTRNGIVSGNVVYNIHNTDDITAACIYVDGGKDIVIEHNRVEASDAGIEVAAENPGFVVSNVTVRNNIIRNNTGNGLILGSADELFGRAMNNLISNNLFYHNGTGDVFGAEIFIQYGEQNIIQNNLVMAAADGSASFFFILGGNNVQTFRNNLWYAPTNGEGDFAWDDSIGCCSTYSSFRSFSGQDIGGMFANPQLVNAAAGDYHLLTTSPARDAGFDDPAQLAAGIVDMDGFARKQGGRVDIGPDEAWPVDAWLRLHFPALAISPAMLELDSDGDGYSNLMEYAAGYSPVLKSEKPALGLSLNRSLGLTFPWVSAQRRPLSVDAPLQLFQSVDLRSWSQVTTPAPVVTATTGERQAIQWRFTSPVSSRGFYRTRAVLTP